MRYALTLAAGLALFAAPVAQRREHRRGPEHDLPDHQRHDGPGRAAHLLQLRRAQPRRDGDRQGRGRQAALHHAADRLRRVGVRRGLAVPDHRAVRLLLHPPREHGGNAHRHAAPGRPRRGRVRARRPTRSAPRSSSRSEAAGSRECAARGKLLRWRCPWTRRPRSRSRPHPRLGTQGHDRHRQGERPHRRRHAPRDAQAHARRPPRARRPLARGGHADRPRRRSGGQRRRRRGPAGP